MSDQNQRPDFLLKSNMRRCKTCGELYVLDVKLKVQPEYWTCPECSSRNKTFITSPDELK
jgi:DNA-directed RNA polymerase subunit RPC12/RpoP